MNQQMIHYALEVEQTQSITRAAHRLYISQSAVSRQIIALEKELGFAVFTRTGGVCIPTSRGQEVLAAFHEYQHACHRLEAQLLALRQEKPQLLTIGFYPGHYAEELLAPAIEAMKRDNEQLSFSFIGVSRKRLREQWQALDVLLAVRSELEVLPATEYETLTLRSMPMVIAISEKHPLAGQAELSLAELSSVPFFYVAEMDGMRCGSLLLEKMAQASGKSPIEIIQGWIKVPNFPSILLNIRNGLGCGFLPDNSKLRDTERFCFYEISDMDEALVLAWKKGRDTRQIRSFIREIARTLG